MLSFYLKNEKQKQKHYSHSPFPLEIKQKWLGSEVARVPTKSSLLILVLSFPGTISCQKCVTSSGLPYFMEHLIWIKLKLLPHQSLHSFFPLSVVSAAIIKLDILLISNKAVSTPFKHQSQRDED